MPSSGANPTGGAFDSVLALELHHDKPTSPLVNAGAMATTSFVRASDPADRWRKILDIQSAFAGRPLSISEEINASEQDTNAHNKAIAWLMYSAGTLFCDPMEACTVYTQQCSTMLNTADLATMGATLAAGGVNPHTGVRVMADSNVRYVLAEMVMEGMYTQSGDWAYTVGVPAKSGVGGGVLAVVPGRLAVAAFSPKLNSAGNSVRGWFAVADVVNRLKLGLFDTPEKAIVRSDRRHPQIPRPTTCNRRSAPSVAPARTAPAKLTDEQRGWLAKASRRDVDGWVHISIGGAPFERGFQYGYLVADEYAESIRVYREMTYQDIGMTYDFFVGQGRRTARRARSRPNCAPKSKVWQPV